MVGPFDCRYPKNRELSNDDLPRFKRYCVYLELHVGDFAQG